MGTIGKDLVYHIGVNNTMGDLFHELQVRLKPGMEMGGNADKVGPMEGRTYVGNAVGKVVSRFVSNSRNVVGNMFVRRMTLDPCETDGMETLGSDNTTEVIPKITICPDTPGSILLGVAPLRQ